jgi:transcriptional regulator
MGVSQIFQTPGDSPHFAAYLWTFQGKRGIFLVMSKGRNVEAQKSEALQGTLDLMAPKVLDALGSQHGHGIASRIGQVIEQVLHLNEGTIYTSLLRLRQQGWIASDWGASENNRKAKYYSITKIGRKQLALETQPQIYLPFSQLPWANMNLLARTATEPHSMVSAVRLRISELDSDQPVTEVQTMDEFMDSLRAQPLSTTLLLAIFSCIALVIAVVGIYGMMSYSVAQRRAEIGVRIALGAEKADILRLVVGQGVRLTAIGIVLGLVVALILTRMMSAFLYKVTAYDMTTFVLGPLVFIVIGMLASYLPARRATQISPTEALRGSV